MKGGVTDGLRISSSWASTSTSPLARFGFTVPSGRRRTVPVHAQHELVAHAVGGGEGLGAVRVANHLHEALAVAQVDEDHAAVVAPAVGPAEQRHGLAEETGGDVAAVVGSHFLFVTPAKAGAQWLLAMHQVPACAGMTALWGSRV